MGTANRRRRSTGSNRKAKTLRGPAAYVLAGIAVVLAGGIGVLAWRASGGPAGQGDRAVTPAATGRQDDKAGGLTIAYPLDETLFPPEMIAPTFRWKDTHRASDTWRVSIEFSDGRDPLNSRSEATQWTPSDSQWEAIKRRSLQKPAKVTVLGLNRKAPTEVLSRGSISISTSADEVGAPLFYREVVLPFIDAVKDPSRLRWRFGAISSKGPPPIVLDKLPVCGNCHSFSADAAVLGMDVDYANSKGSYVIDQVAEEMLFEQSKIITWDDYQKDENELSFGLLSQVSPDGKYVVSTVKDRSVFVPRPDLAFSQLFFPIKGILAFYCRQTKTFHALPGADDRRFVHSNPTWSPDGKYIVFARTKAHELKHVRDTKKVLLSAEECREFVEGERLFRYDLYRIPFNGGRGGRAEPLPGASNNGISNFFPRYSPDGKWIVFCRARTFMLLQPDSQLYIIPAAGGKAARLRCNTSRMNSWHSWSPNGKWLVFSSKANSPYTQLFLTHIDRQGRSTPAVLLPQFTAPDRAANIPEFVNAPAGAIKRIRERFLDDYSYFRAGREFIIRQDYRRAAEAYRKAVELNPDYAEAHANLGTSLSNQGMFEEAERHLRKAVELKPDDKDVHHNLGVVLLRQQKLTQAITHCAEAVRIDPQFFEARLTLGNLLLNAGQPRQAEEHLARAVALRPRDWRARDRLGVAFSALGKPVEAIAQFRAVLQQQPDHAPTHYRLGRALLGQKQPREAERHFASAIRIDPDVPEFHYSLGQSFYVRGEAERAMECYRRAIELKSDFASALNDLAWIHATSPKRPLRDGDRAVALARRAADLAARPDPAVLDTLAAAYAEAGRFDRAAETARKARALAEQAGQVPLADQIGGRLELYLAEKPFRQPAP